MISPYSVAWRLHEESERRFLGQSLRLPAGAPYWRPEPGAEDQGPGGETVYGFRLRYSDGQLVTVDGVNVDCRGSMEEPTVFLRFESEGATCWTSAVNVELPAEASPRERLSLLAEVPA
jgi:hypothetical protein